jgi:hypothetical protein
MGQGFRYKVQHLGDIIVDKLDGICDVLGSCTRGIVLTYDMRELEGKKRKVVGKIGERIAEVRKKSPELDIFKDEKMMELFTKLENIEERIETCNKERQERLSPAENTA